MSDPKELRKHWIHLRAHFVLIFRKAFWGRPKFSTPSERVVLYQCGSVLELSNTQILRAEQNLILSLTL